MEASVRLEGRASAAGAGGGRGRPVVDDRDLVRRAQEGDIAAFETLYRGSVGLIHALCLRMVGSPTQAEDLTQEVFVRAWRKLGSFRGESAFTTWLTRLAVNVVLSSRRRQRQWEGKMTVVDDLEPFAGPAPSSHPGQAVDLERAIAGLPAGARTVFVLHDVHGLEHAEIAAATGSAVGTCKAQLHRARRLLKEVLSR
jgi:RNA polymerase sigma-70 factor (ECF subfamily)